MGRAATRPPPCDSRGVARLGQGCVFGAGDEECRALVEEMARRAAHCVGLARLHRMGGVADTGELAVGQRRGEMLPRLDRRGAVERAHRYQHPRRTRRQRRSVDRHRPAPVAIAPTRDRPAAGSLADPLDTSGRHMADLRASVLACADGGPTQWRPDRQRVGVTGRRGRSPGVRAGAVASGIRAARQIIWYRSEDPAQAAGVMSPASFVRPAADTAAAPNRSAMRTVLDACGKSCSRVSRVTRRARASNDTAWQTQRSAWTPDGRAFSRRARCSA